MKLSVSWGFDVLKKTVFLYISVSTCIFLTGCAGKEIVTETIESKNPIPVPCIDRNEVPDPVPPASEFATIESPDGKKIEVVVVEVKRQRAQNKALRALIEECIK